MDDETMILFPYCKINLGLQILRKRLDGFHDLDTVFLPVKGWCDVLEILPAGAGLHDAASGAGLHEGGAGEAAVSAAVSENGDSFVLSGKILDGAPNDNLVCRAREAMRKAAAEKGQTLPPCHIHLHKVLPSGAGLGGGSSDATHTLLGLNHVFNLGFSPQEIEDLSRPLGSDCAFFSADAPARATGRGDVLERLTATTAAGGTAATTVCGTNATTAATACPTATTVASPNVATITAHTTHECYLWVVVPPLHISTPQAYAGARAQAGRPTLPECLALPLSEWKHYIENDFERTLFPKWPVLQNIKEKFYELGAFYASLSGSGSALFGLFDKWPEAARMQGAFPDEYISFQTRISIPLIRK